MFHVVGLAQPDSGGRRKGEDFLSLVGMLSSASGSVVRGRWEACREVRAGGVNASTALVACWGRVGRPGADSRGCPFRELGQVFWSEWLSRLGSILICLALRGRSWDLCFDSQIRTSLWLPDRKNRRPVTVVTWMKALESSSPLPHPSPAGGLSLLCMVSLTGNPPLGSLEHHEVGRESVRCEGAGDQGAFRACVQEFSRVGRAATVWDANGVKGGRRFKEILLCFMKDSSFGDESSACFVITLHFELVPFWHDSYIQTSPWSKPTLHGLCARTPSWRGLTSTIAHVLSQWSHLGTPDSVMSPRACWTVGEMHMPNIGKVRNTWKVSLGTSLYDIKKKLPSKMPKPGRKLRIKIRINFLQV